MRREPRNKQPEEFSSTILDLARVTRVTKGGKHLRFRACVGIGDKKGRVGIGVAKGNDVSIAVEKAKTQAKKNLIKAPITAGGTIPHAIETKFKAAKIFMKPAASGVVRRGEVRHLYSLGRLLGAVVGTEREIRGVVLERHAGPER